MLKVTFVLAAALLPVAFSAVHADPVLEIDGKKLADTDLPDAVRNTLYDAQIEAYDKNALELEQLGVRYFLAKEKNKDVDLKHLPEIGDVIKAKDPTEAEVKKFFEENKNRLPPNAPYEQYKENVAQFLKEQSVRTAYEEKVAELRKSGKIKLLTKAPVAPTVALDVSAYPSIGPKDAKVTLVEASDYLCPHCQAEQPEVEALLKEFGGKLRFVQVNYALRPDGLSGSLARGAFCASKLSDDAFWKYHKAVFAKKMEQSQGDDAANKKVVVATATEAGVTGANFESCIDTPEAKAFVAKAIESMSAAGVAGTPTFFLNGRKVQTDQGGLRTAVAEATAKASNAGH